MRERHPKYEIFRESTEPKITELLVPAPEEPKNDFSSPLGFLNQLIELGKFQQELKEFDHLGLIMLSYEGQFPILTKVTMVTSNFIGWLTLGII